MFVISKDGFVIESITTAGAFNPDALAAMITAAIGATESMGKELELGRPEIVTMEFTGSIVLVMDLGDSVLALVADRNAVLGRLRYEMKKQAPRIRAAL
ncbi:MAG: roadblock/LC7 domain-containing protein [Thermoprotei archaeon]|nr:MAG: roadblock/LC7 domain-containing protein [Thermoprotei archaeon]